MRGKMRDTKCEKRGKDEKTKGQIRDGRDVKKERQTFR